MLICKIFCKTLLGIIQIEYGFVILGIFYKIKNIVFSLIIFYSKFFDVIVRYHNAVYLINIVNTTAAVYLKT